MKNWKISTLEEVCRFSNGLWKGEKPPFVNVGVIRNTNFTKEGTLDAADIAYLDVEAKKFESRSLQFGDIILEKSGGGPKQPVGRVILFDRVAGDFSFSNSTAALRVRNPLELDFRFLHKFLYWIYVSGGTEQMQSHSTGIRNLDGNAYKAIQIFFPSLAEQQNIVAVLIKAFESIATARANAEKNLKNARALFESHLQFAFANLPRSGESAKKLDELCELIVDCEHKTAPTQDEGIPLIRTPNIGKGKLLLDSVYRVAEQTYKLWARRAEPKGGDLILAREAPAGNVAVIPENIKVCLGQRTVLIHSNSQLLNSDFLAFLLLRPEMQSTLLAHSSGATVQHVNMKDIRALQIDSLPSLKDQAEFVRRMLELIEKIESLAVIYQKQLYVLDELIKSLLHQAFSGQLTDKRCEQNAILQCA